MFDFSVCFSLQLWRYARFMTGAFSLLLCYQIFIKMVKNRSFLEKKYDYHYQKTVYILSFPMCSLLLILFQGCARWRFSPFSTWTLIQAYFELHPRGSVWRFTAVVLRARLWLFLFFAPPAAPSRHSACEQNTVRKPQPTKCWVSFLIIFPICFAVRVCLYLVSFGIFNCSFICVCVFQIYIRFVVESLSLSFS